MQSLLKQIRCSNLTRFSKTFSTQITPTFPGGRRKTDITSEVAEFISGCDVTDIPDGVISRSKRMILDTIGVGIIGANSEVSSVIRDWAIPTADVHADYNTPTTNSQRKSGNDCVVWGTSGLTTTPTNAAFLNGVAIHSMDFDDTWHPATHPSGAVLATLAALAGNMQQDKSLQDLLVAFNVGVEVQGRLLKCSSLAKRIPTKFHPPAVVGVMGSAAAACNFLNLDPHKCRHALAIAASFAGAPMANAGTMTKPLHCGKSARSGLESALFADAGIEGNGDILDLKTGFGVFYDDYDANVVQSGFVLEVQDVAIKRFPTHLGTHWAIDAAMETRNEITDITGNPSIDPNDVDRVVINVPSSCYINRRFPATEYEARHSFQFNVCTTLLDGNVTPKSYHKSLLRRLPLTNLLNKTVIHTTLDNQANFNAMFVDVTVVLTDGTIVYARCDTPYGHWRKPLSHEDLRSKFLQNTTSLSNYSQMRLIAMVENSDRDDIPVSHLIDLL